MTSVPLSLETFALLPAQADWPPYFLALLGTHGGASVQLDANVPEALSVLACVKDELTFNVIEDWAVHQGSWRFYPEPYQGALPSTFDAEKTWLLLTDDGHWVVIATWNGPTSRVELHSMWIRDEVEVTAIGAMSGILRDLIASSLAPMEGEAFTQLPAAKRGLELLHAASELRASARAEAQEILKLAEAHAESEGSDEALAAWEQADTSVERLVQSPWERLLKRS